MAMLPIGAAAGRLAAMGALGTVRAGFSLARGFFGPGARMISQSAGGRALTRALPAGSARRSLAIGAGGAAGFDVATNQFGVEIPFVDLPNPFSGGGSSGNAIGSPGDAFGTSFIVKVWTTNPSTGFPAFARLADGRIVVTRADGSLKSYRPRKPIVLSTNPRVRDLARAARTVDRLTAAAVKTRVQSKRAKARLS